MARKSVVTQPAPQRTAVVLRAGPRQGGGDRADRIALILGVLLLLLAVWLAVALPADETVIPQYQASFPDLDAVDHPSQAVAIPEGDEATLDYEVAEPNVYTVQVTVEVTDDQPTTLPDTFEVQLVTPNGTVLDGGPISTDRPVFNSTTGQFESPRVRQVFTFGIVPKPQDRILTAASPNETLEEATARVAPTFNVDNRGTWQVRIYLREAGNCPDAGPDPSLLLQSTMCLRDHPNGQDPGNDISVTLLRTSSYRVEIGSLVE